MKGYLLDSVILIDRLNHIPQAEAFITKHHRTTHISVITRSEVLVGCNERVFHTVERMLDFFPTLTVTASVADSAALLRQRYGWKLPDALQAAIALEHDLLLVTRNDKDFDAKQLDFVLTPYTLETTM